MGVGPQGYQSLLVSHREPQGCSKGESSLWTRFWLRSGSPLVPAWVVFLLGSEDRTQGQGVLGQASDKGQRTLFFGLGHLRFTLAHRVLTLGFLFPFFFLSRAFFCHPSGCLT